MLQLKMSILIILFFYFIGTAMPTMLMTEGHEKIIVSRQQIVQIRGTLLYPLTATTNIFLSFYCFITSQKYSTTIYLSTEQLMKDIIVSVPAVTNLTGL